LKSIIKKFLPPILLETYRKIRYKEYGKPVKIWEGIYSSFSEIPSESNLKNSFYTENEKPETWCNILTQDAQILKNKTEKYKIIPKDVHGEHTLLPLLISLIFNKNEKINILDFGGGLGNEYLMLNKSVVNIPKIEYTIFEIEAVCKAGISFYKNDKSIKFISELPNEFPGLDILFIKTSLQYFENYTSILNQLCSYNSTYIFFVKLSAVEIPSYVSAQVNMPGMLIPYWFISAAELIELLAKHGYSLIYKSAIDTKYYQDNFPELYQMGPTSNFLFKKNDY
jgi:putative methyltransferase (TIGR04325 family)